jgi:hypothetical protein
VRRIAEDVAPGNAKVLEAAMRAVDIAANRAKQSDRDAIVFQAERIREGVGLEMQHSVPVVLLDVEWAPDWPKKALADLGRESPADLAELKRRVGTGEDLGSVERLIHEPDDWLARAPGHAWVALARFAEHHGEWLLANEAWEQVLRDPPKADPIPALIHCAMNAEIAGNFELRKQYLDRAAELDADHPRLRLELVSGINEPSAQLEALAGLSFEQPDQRGILEARRALAYLLLGDLEQAKAHTRRAREHAPDLIQVQTLEVNLAIQDARDAANKGEPYDSGATREAGKLVLDVRKKLLAQKRPEESARLLMLAADAALLAGDQQRAANLFAQATEDERRSATGDEALADGALRARAPGLALDLLYPDKPDNDTRRRIRAVASLFNARRRPRQSDRRAR